MPFDDKAATINALISSVESIEQELGLLPSGVYASVRTRLDILEARINNPNAPAPNVENPFIIGNTGVTLSTGVGAPTENRVFGSLYLREDGYNIQGLYAFRPDGYWHQIDTDPWTAAGDLAGNIYGQTVIGLQGRPVKATAPIIDGEGDGYVLTWGADGYWEPQIGFYAAGDLTGNKINQRVSFLQGTKLNIGVPTDGYVLTWNGSLSEWDPQRAAVIFDALDNNTSTNVRTNRFATQSPINHAQSGIVNLGSDTVQTTSGVTASYSSVLGGDQNQVTAGWATAVGGLVNNVGGAYSAILGGNQNQVTGQYSSVVGGLTNTASLDYSFIGGGASHQITGTGSNNTITGGFSNSITGTSNHSSILGGSTNSIIGQKSSIVGGIDNTLHNDLAFIGGGQSHTLTGPRGVILGGNTNSVTATSGLVLNGDNNTVAATYASIVNGTGNTISSTGLYSTVAGVSNTVGDQFAAVFGQGNIIASGTNKFVNVVGDFNTANAGSHYSGVWGCNNATSDGYVAVFGDHNTISTNSTYTDVHGRVNTVAAQYTSVWGHDNTIALGSTFGSIFGYSNAIATNAPNSFVVGYNNNVASNASNSFIVGYNSSTTGTYNSAWGNAVNVNGNYSSGWGQTITLASTANGYSNAWGNSLSVTGNWTNVWGSHNTVASDYSNVFGYYHANITGTGSLVHGKYGQATNPGQYTHAANTFTGTTAGTGQFSRLMLTGSGASGAALALTTDGSSAPLLEDGKSYDMFVKIDVTQTTGTTGVCARYTFDVLAHRESGTVTIDRVNTYLVSDNGTGWVGNNWTGIFAAGTTTVASGSNGLSLPQGTINVASTTQFPSSGTIYVLTSAGYQAVAYTGKTSTTFTGCTVAYSPQYGGSLGTMSTGGNVYTLTGSTFSIQLPSSGSQTRRAVASLEWREVTRL